MKSIKFDTDTGAIPLVNGDVVMITGKDAILQNLKAFLHIAKGEYFLNQNYGIDYFNHGYTTDSNKNLFDADVLSWLRKRSYVKSITGYKSVINNGEIVVTIDQISTTDETLFNVEVVI